MTRMDLPPVGTDYQARLRGMCDQHLNGNHNEAHQLAGYLRSADADTGALQKLIGHAARGQIDIERLAEWHDACEAEMRRRGWQPDSPLNVSVTIPLGTVSPSTTNPLETRCDACEVGA